MLDNLQALRAELSKLQQQQSHQHSSGKHSPRSHKKSSMKKKCRRLEGYTKGIGEEGIDTDKDSVI